MTSAADSQRDSGSEQRDSGAQHDDAQHHAALGVSLAESDGNVRVIAVAPGSPAAQAGIRVGDEIRYVNDQRIRTTHGLVEEISDFHPGEKVSLTIRRSGQNQTVHATLADRNAVFHARQAARGRMAYSYGGDEAGSQRMTGSQQEQVQNLQQQVNRLQRQVGSMQATRAQGWWTTQPRNWEDRTDLRRSSPRGWSRDHGPRETTSGNVANED